MKKIITLILVLTMLLGASLSLTSCADKDDNTLVCGVTIIPGLNEQDADGNWIGFESEFAMAVGEIIGMEVEFKKIDWKQKYNELKSGSIDCIWNGFTANSSDDGVKRSDLVDFSYGYMFNRQCIVVKQSDLSVYKTEADLSGKKAAVEAGSAGEDYAVTVTSEDKITKRPTQMDAFTFLKSGVVDFLVVDIVLANNLCGKGNYSDLAIVSDIQLDSEIYAVGFKKGSDLTAKVNAAIKELEENGKLMEIATKYGFESVINVTEEIE